MKQKNSNQLLPILSLTFHSTVSDSVITGATDGIGREYARGLAKRRINVILISRTESKLLELCSEIKLKYGVQAKYIVADFTRGAPIYANIENTLKEVPVGILGETKQNFSYITIVQLFTPTPSSSFRQSIFYRRPQ